MDAPLRFKTSRPLPRCRAILCFLAAAMDPLLEHWAQDLLHCLMPNPQSWQYFHEAGTNITVFSRGTFRGTTVLGVERLYHGTTLDISYKILREGFRVGAGQHRHDGMTRRGIFAMEAPDGNTAQALSLIHI